MRATRLAATVAVFVVTAASVSADFAGFEGGETQDWYTEVDRKSYILQSGTQANPNYIHHSYSFVSANDLGNTEFVCAILGTPNGDYGECGTDFERYCYYAWTHSSNDLDCHDRDGHAWRAGTINKGFRGTTIRIHGTF
jgi:hypothetical protein